MWRDGDFRDGAFRYDGAFPTLRRERPISCLEIPEPDDRDLAAGHRSLTRYDDV